VCLVPFVNKAFHVDDPLFLWAGRHIQRHPVDFYGFDVNWYAADEPMWQVTMNPPLASYYLALAAAPLGWGEGPLHLAFLLPAGAVIWGTYRLAERFGSRPLLAALAALFTPVFLVSATGLMCDTLMLAFWVWAVVFWVRGVDEGRFLPLCLAGALAGLAFLTKYFAVSLVPLLAAYALARRPRGWPRWALALAIPVAVAAGYQALTYHLYGVNLFQNAVVYVRENQEGGSRLGHVLASLGFVGGCVASVLFLAPLLFARRVLLAGPAVAAVLAAAAWSVGDLDGFAPAENGQVRWAFLAQFAVFSAGGVAVLGLAALDLARRRDGPALLLFLWVFGTWAFTAFVNWSINGRSVLPLVPAVGVLVVRQLDCRYGPGPLPMRPAWLLVPSAALALAVAAADYQLAGSARTAATEFARQLVKPTRRVWFQGHWGFQYYLQARGGVPFDATRFNPRPGDLLIVPENNTNVTLRGLPPHRELTPPVEVPVLEGLTTFHPQVGAGFYYSALAPLPFAFGTVPPERYHVYAFAGPPRPGPRLARP
jgi:4-amino-4-deoxy-L-arabinose transferase-like glycosyltransferase